MKEQQWKTSVEPVDMLQYLNALAPGNARRFRLFGCACARRVWHVLKKRKSVRANREAIEIAERFADGLANAKELQAALTAAKTPTCGSAANSNVYQAAVYTAHFAARDAGWAGPGDWATQHGAELEAQAELVRDIFGNPFRKRPKVKKAWLTDTALTLARQMYESRDFGAMPILADALQDAGCNSEDILSHCRGEGSHVRGCWVVDLVLGRV